MCVCVILFWERGANRTVSQISATQQRIKQKESLSIPKTDYYSKQDIVSALKMHTDGTDSGTLTDTHTKQDPFKFAD